jgi:ketosteroid isomerase-like protein
MSQETVEIVRRIYRAWGRGNSREGAELYDPHALLVLRPEFGLASGEWVYCGPDEVARFMREVFLPEWEGLVIAGDEFVDAGDSVVVHVDQRGTGRQSRAPGQLRYFQGWTFRGSSVIRIESVMARAEAFEAVGLPR